MRKFDLDERLITFAVECVEICEALPDTVAGRYYSGQLVRSSGSPALHYGEAQGAESTKDFVHKLRVCLKELRESFNCLRIINRKGWLAQERFWCIDECNQLISIFVKSILTALRNGGKGPNESDK